MTYKEYYSKIKDKDDLMEVVTEDINNAVLFYPHKLEVIKKALEEILEERGENI